MENQEISIVDEIKNLIKEFYVENQTEKENYILFLSINSNFKNDVVFNNLHPTLFKVIELEYLLKINN